MQRFRASTYKLTHLMRIYSHAGRLVPQKKREKNLRKVNSTNQDVMLALCPQLEGYYPPQTEMRVVAA